MKQEPVIIGTRDSELALWQARLVLEGLQRRGIEGVLAPLKSEGDIDLVTPLYAMGVQGVFTRALDAALLAGRIDIAVHSMKDVPTQLAQGIQQAAVLPRGNHRDILVPKKETDFLHSDDYAAVIATSSIRRKAQWLHRYPQHRLVNLRGNVNTRLRKLQEENWDAAIFAAAGLERIGLRPASAVNLDWMLPAPAQGAIMVVCRQNDAASFEKLHLLNHAETALCTKTERDFLNTLMGGCSTPISALAQMENDRLHFRGAVHATDGSAALHIEKTADADEMAHTGMLAAKELLDKGAAELVTKSRNHG